jgi:serine protease Do
MENQTRKIVISCALAFSCAALGLGIFMLRQQAILSNQLQAVIALEERQKKLAPARIVSAENGNTWLDVQKKIKDTVVQVFGHISEFNWLEPYKSPEQNETAGSGFFINANGDIITNYHVIAQANSIELQIPSFGMERFDATIVGVSPERDIALLALTPDAKERIIQRIKNIPFLQLGDSDTILRSQEVLALGYPLGQTRLKSTLGIVSGRERMGNCGYIQITAPINVGNSGGPAIDTNGNVIGINSRGVLEAQNVGYIIPINEVKSALQDLYKVKLLRKPTLGCIFTAATSEMVKYLTNPGDGGWYIAKVFKGTLLDGVGIEEGDMLYELNGHRVDMYGDVDVPWSEDKASIFEFLNRLTVGDKLTMGIFRKGSFKEFSFKFEPKYLPPVRMIYPEFEPEAIDYESIGGLVVMQLALNHVGMLLSRAPDLVRYGKIDLQHEPTLIITNILQNSQASKARVLRPGELVTEVNGERVQTLADFRKAILINNKSGYITIRTDDNFYSVLSVEKIIRDEDTLAARYFFRKSKLIDELAKTIKPAQPKEVKK